MKSFATGQRVQVVQDGNGIALNAVGTVVRIRTDGAAWVALDERSKVEKVHPFAAEDPRGCHVLACPWDCTMAEGNRKERRAAQGESRRDEALVSIGIAQFGRDHWSTFAYIETVCVDGDGSPNKMRMRCVDARHPLQSHGHDASDCPTRLRDGTKVPGHDDWDCAADLIAAGLLEDLGTAMRPLFCLTEAGQAMASKLRIFKASGGSFATFDPTAAGS